MLSYKQESGVEVGSNTSTVALWIIDDKKGTQCLRV
jgi:hypothetical protein